MLIDREATVASSWRRHYTRLHLHTIKQYSAMPGMPWPAGAPQYPSREDVVTYLSAYAAERAVAPRLNVTVTRIARTGDRFTVATNAGTLSPAVVVVATGCNDEPRRLPFPGLDACTATVVHSREYRDPAPFAGKRTLVVGCGNSGAEIALDLAEHGVPVSMVVRGPMHVVPRDMFGRPSQKTSVMLSRLPIAVRDALIVRLLKRVVGDLSPWGITRPAKGPMRLVEDEGRIPLIDVGTIAMVKAGRIRVVPGVQRIDANLVRFANGVEQEFDAIILATGYAPQLDLLVDGFAAIADARGRPRQFAEETAIPGLYFVGFRNRPTGLLREIAIEATRVADDVAARVRQREAMAGSRPPGD